MTLTLVYIFALALAPTIKGVPYLVRHERARRAAKIDIFPPRTTIEVHDEIQF